MIPEFANQTQISEWLGHCPKTVRARLKGRLDPAYMEGKQKFYSIKDALPLIFRPEEAGDGVLSLPGERAKLAKAQREKIEIEIEEKKGNLVDIHEWKKEYSAEITACRDRLLAIPLKLASELAGTDSSDEIYETLTQTIEDAFVELSETGTRGEPDEASDQGDSQ